MRLGRAFLWEVVEAFSWRTALLQHELGVEIVAGIEEVLLLLCSLSTLSSTSVRLHHELPR